RRGTTGVRAARPRGIQAPGDRQAARDRARDVEISIASCAHGAAEASRIMRSAECGMRNAECGSEGRAPMSDAWTERLSEYIDETLSEGERVAIEAHLASC